MTNNTTNQEDVKYQRILEQIAQIEISVDRLLAKRPVSYDTLAKLEIVKMALAECMQILHREEKVC